ncbi:MAG: hypothetical protein A2Y33_06480 [Spirochaetes bacterium GWF1_51_8]|nr:MAG: hypothetical protein A2Y33_06480 [Spirochaetes bacterium GWF1_51_8]
MLRLFSIAAVAVMLLSCGNTKPEGCGAKDAECSEKNESCITNFNDLKANEGKKIVLIGKKAGFEMEHMLAFFMEPMKYIAVDLPDGSQILAYSKDKIECAKKIKLIGTVSSVTGAGKGGGDHTEFYLVIDKWECIE